MKKKTITISIIILVLIIIILGSLTGFPITSKIENAGCTAEYKKYIFPNHLCQYITFGHCPTTSLNKYNAEMEVTHCLCDKYKAESNPVIANEILSRCNIVKPNCDQSIERIQIKFCNEKGLNSVECTEYFNDEGKSRVDFICDNKEQVFYKIYID